MGTLDRTLLRISVLIGILLLIAYRQGTVDVIGAVSSSLGNIINLLQGRNASGAFAAYPR